MSNITTGQSRPNFFDRFRIVAAEFLSYSADRESISPIFDDCPIVCGQDGTRRTEFCEGCEILDARTDYKERAESALETHFAETKQGGQFTFDVLNRCIIDVLDFEDLPRHRLTVNAARLVGILAGERRRISRLKDWNEKQNANRD